MQIHFAEYGLTIFEFNIDFGVPLFHLIDSISLNMARDLCSEKYRKLNSIPGALTIY